MATEHTSLQWMIFGVFITTLVPLGMGLRNFARLSATGRSIFWLVLVSFIMDAIGRMLWLFKVPNLFIGHFSTVFEFWFMIRVFQQALRGFLPKESLTILAVVFTGFAIVNVLFLQGFDSNNSYTRAIQGICMIVLALLYFLKLARELKVERLEKEPLFWFNAGILMFFSGNLFIYLYSN